MQKFPSPRGGGCVPINHSQAIADFDTIIDVNHENQFAIINWSGPF